jgi:hypothetical protein
MAKKQHAVLTLEQRASRTLVHYHVRRPELDAPEMPFQPFLLRSVIVRIYFKAESADIRSQQTTVEWRMGNGIFENRRPILGKRAVGIF